MIAKRSSVWTLVIAVAAGLAATTLQGCATYPDPQTPEEFAAALDRQQQRADFAARLGAAGAALRGGSNGRMVTCTTSLGVTNCI